MIRKTCSAALAGLVASIGVVLAQGAPTPGGTLTVAMRSSPGNFDCHAGQGYGVMQMLAPAYSTLLKYAPGKYPEIIGDVAKSWTVSEDRLTYTFTLNPDVMFHDGSKLTATDIKATFDRLRDPPQASAHCARPSSSDIASIDVADPQTVAFRLKAANPAMLTVFASPWHCIYSAAKLAQDPNFPARNIMGTGPFKFVEYATGSKVTYAKFPQYFKKGQPYLDKVEFMIVSSTAVVPALSAGQIDADFFTLGAPLVQQVATARGDKVSFDTAETTVSSFVSFNTRKPIFQDPRVRKALSLAIDRPLGDRNLPRLIAVKGYNPLFRPDTPFSLSSAQLADLPGFGSSVEKAQEEARRLLKEAGVPNLTFELLAINSRDPWEAYAIFLIDSWRKIGVQVTKKSQDLAGFLPLVASGDFEAAIDFNSPMSMDPNEVLVKFVPGSPNNYTRMTDETLTKLFNAQKGEADGAKRQDLARQFQMQLLKEAYVAPLYWATRTTSVPSSLQGWKVPPNFSLWLDLADVWLKK